MVDDKAYPIDVAYSFVQEDEEVAAQVDSLLKNRLSTFLYSERQGELVGADGEARLKRVFGEEARIVVVFYRTEWGTTPWTRIEETAIRDRAYTEGYDFTIFVCMDQSKLKDWVPKTRGPRAPPPRRPPNIIGRYLRSNNTPHRLARWLLALKLGVSSRRLRIPRKP